eukprot:4414579-Prymnesium_polylepis.1
MPPTSLRRLSCGSCARYTVWARDPKREPCRMSFRSSSSSRNRSGSVLTATYSWQRYSELTRSQSHAFNGCPVAI